jgi:hypothetical protein
MHRRSSPYRSISRFMCLRFRPFEFRVSITKASQSKDVLGAKGFKGLSRQEKDERDVHQDSEVTVGHCQLREHLILTRLTTLQARLPD